MLRPDLVSVSSSVIELLGSFVFRSGGEDSEENDDHSPEARPLEEVAKSRLVFNGVDQSIAMVLTLWRLASKIRSLSRMCLPSHTHAQVVRGGVGACVTCPFQDVPLAQQVCYSSIVKRNNLSII